MLKIIQLALILIMTAPFAAGSEAEAPVSTGIWFRCEFAHSQIPPEDNCKMLDDDGFQVIKGVVHHVKILDSEEAKCRQNRVGHCFRRDQIGLSAERSKIGPIKLSPKFAEITWMGCTQRYGLIRHPDYIEIAPRPERCWWASDKRYFVARYAGQIKITAED